MSMKTVKLLADTLPVSFEDHGNGRPFLLLHGGAGAHSMTGLAESLGQAGRSILPSHPGFDGRPRPNWFGRVDDLVLAYCALIERLDIKDVVLVGNSAGGWVAAELCLRASPRITELILIDSVGLDPSPAGGIVDTAKVASSELLRLSFFDPARSALAPSSPEQVAAMVANQKSLIVYAGKPYMNDPELRHRLPDTATPTLVLWGENDQIVSPAYGRQFAELIPEATFKLIPEAGHFPQLERLDLVSKSIKDFVSNG